MKGPTHMLIMNNILSVFISRRRKKKENKHDRRASNTKCKRLIHKYTNIYLHGIKENNIHTRTCIQVNSY